MATSTRRLREEAFRFAREAHAAQRRETDAAPYVQHPVDVADLLEDAGLREEVVAAALLHEVLEDTDVSAEEVERRFGPEVGGLVGAMTESPDIERYEERKAEHRGRIAAAGSDAAAIFLADKVAKARDLRAALSGEGEGAALDRRLDPPLEAKLDHYEQTLAVLESSAPNAGLADTLRRELVALRGRAAEVESRLAS